MQNQWRKPKDGRIMDEDDYHAMLNDIDEQEQQQAVILNEDQNDNT